MSRPRALVASVGTTCAAVALALAPGAAPAASARTTADTCKPLSSASTSWSAAVPRAKDALAAATTAIQRGKLDQALEQLRTVRRQVRIAHTGATALIGLPPTDPESDDPPGVSAVLKVGGLEHQVAMKLVPPFDGLRGRAVLNRLGSALNVAAACRDVMLGTVIALPSAKRDDYVDGLSDTMPTFDQELDALSTGLTTYDLAQRGRARLEKAQGVVTATRDAMEPVFGGGERVPR